VGLCAVIPPEAALLERLFSTEKGKQLAREDSHAPISSPKLSSRGSSFTAHSLSVVLPAYNKEQVIASTVEQVTRELANLTRDFEGIVVNDGSTDGTGAVLSTLQKLDQCIRVLTHEYNQGYGAALALWICRGHEGPDLFMDSDGQFDICDLRCFLSLIDAYDAVIGYRTKHQDSWMRNLNAWDWKLLVRLTLDVRVRDLDCAFKLLRIEFLHSHPLETHRTFLSVVLALFCMVSFLAA
jgi:glycosyltransferase involved in cell wall biosynthesis